MFYPNRRRQRPAGVGNLVSVAVDQQPGMVCDQCGAIKLGRVKAELDKCARRIARVDEASQDLRLVRLPENAAGLPPLENCAA